MRILALDLGTKTGWVLSTGPVEHGIQIFDVKRGESPGMRYLRFNRWLEDLVLTTILNHGKKKEPVIGSRVDLIVYEQTHHRGGAATEVAAGFATRVQEFCARYGIHHAAVHSATLKKFATGKGNAKKPAMIEAARKKLGYQGKSDDEADALWLLEYARRELVGGIQVDS